MTRALSIAWLVAGGFVLLLGEVAQAQKPPASVREFVTSLHAASVDRPVDFARRDFSKLDLAGLNFKRARLDGANLFGADLTDADLRGVDLSGATLDRTILLRTDLSGADLRGASLLLPAGFLDAETAARSAPRFAGANLAGARVFAELHRVDFRGANLSGADLRRYTVGVGRTSLRYCDFTDARFAGANLTQVNLNSSTFVNADFSNANLTEANFANADLTGADLTNAVVTGANFHGATLVGVKGLVPAGDRGGATAR
jgi:uncharacterized protein YjbI with pentapeptide repeats